MFGAEAREIQLDVPRVSASRSDDVAENGGDLRIGQFVTGYLEQHGQDDSRMGTRFCADGCQNFLKWYLCIVIQEVTAW